MGPMYKKTIWVKLGSKWWMKRAEYHTSAIVIIML